MVYQNSWILYKRHREQLNIPKKEEKTLLDFSCELAESLVKANKNVASSSRGRPPKRKSDVVTKAGKRATVAIPCNDVRYDGLGHWPVPNKNRSRCCKCQNYCRMVCEKCNIYLCLLEDRNCFKLFHT